MLTDKIIKIPSITIVIKSLIEKDNKFYLELSLSLFVRTLALGFVVRN